MSSEPQRDELRMRDMAALALSEPRDVMGALEVKPVMDGVRAIALWWSGVRSHTP